MHVMAPLIANPNTPSQSTRPAAPPSSFRMPHVFVIPPEEEQQDNPPWCCFDADEQPEHSGDFPSNPNIHFLDVPYLFQPPENDVPIPITRRISVHHPRPRAPASKKLEKKQRPEAIEIVETKSSRTGQRDARDSDVIEVVKVKRGREALADLEENTKVKRSKTLKARATKALQSIKNVGKTSHRTHVKDLWTSTESTPATFKGMQEQDKSEDHPPSAPPKKGSLSRASSRSLSQIFQPMKPSRLESTFTSFVAPAKTYHTLPIANSPSLPHLRFNDMNSTFNEVPSDLTTDDAPNKPVSPIPSMKKKINTKFSVRELHRLFSFSSSSPDDPSPLHTVTAALFSPASITSKPSMSTPVSPHDYPDVPMEEDIFGDAHFVDLESPDRRLASRYHQVFHTRRRDDLSAPRRLSDLSFEMKLDSLHFDALSFDAEDFHIPREGSALR